MKTVNLSFEIDKTDIQILDLLIQNSSNKHISSELRIPLSTIQRRVRKLIENGYIATKNHIDFTKFGFKSGTIHIYLDDGNIDAILAKASKLKGVTSLEVHIGNSDIIAGVIYKEGKELLDVIAAVKRMQGVERIVWSERIFEYNFTVNTISLLGLEK